MLLYGDEMRRTAEGDNNTVFQDNHLNWINWENEKRHADILDFTRKIIHFRKKHQIVRRTRFKRPIEADEAPPLRNITWHGVKPNEPDFGGGSRFLAWVLEPFELKGKADQPIYVATNTYWEPVTIDLPTQEGYRWSRIADTNLPPGADIVDQDSAEALTANTYTLQPRSTIVLLGKK